MLMKIINRFKSPVFIFSLILLICKQFDYTKFVTDENLSKIIELLINIFIGIGLINNPENNYFTRKK